MSEPLQPAFAGDYALERSSDKATVLVVYALYLAGFVTGGLSTLVGLVMCYVLRDGASAIARSHYLFLARTFWVGALLTGLGVLIFAIGLPLSMVLIGLPLLALGGLVLAIAPIWFAVRCIVGLLGAMDDRPYRQPLTLWI